MIEHMTKYSFVLLSTQQDEFLEHLQELGLVDVTRSSKPIDDSSSELLSHAEELKKRIKDIEAGRLERDPEYVSLKQSLEAARRELSDVRVWGTYDQSAVQGLSQMGLKMRFYSVQTKKYDPAWAELQPLEVIEDDGKTTWFVTVGPEDGYEFPLPEAPTPQHPVEWCEHNVETLESHLQTRTEQLSAESELVPALREEYQNTLTELDMYLAKSGGQSAAEGYVSVVEGFAPVADDARVQQSLDALPDVYYLAEPASVEQNPPIKFKNNPFSRMFEMLTDMYGRPEYNGFDPTPFISIFFMLFFAFCMGDAGYGLILILVGLAMRKMGGMSKMAPLVTTLGCATTVIGFLFHTFFSIDIAQWQCMSWFKWFLPAKIAGFDGTMVLSLIVGIFHISLAMIVKTIMATRNKGFLQSLGTWGWTLLIVGGVVVGLLALIGVLDKTATKWTIIVLGVLSAVGIFILNNIHRNPLINIGSGLWDTYNMATGLLGDVLSYLRLYALGLAGSMLGLAFNNIGMMIAGDGSSFVMWIPAVLVLIVGHTLNIAMCALGAFVHPLRLNFLEFFKNSGYEAGGRKFNPFSKNRL